ncbi:MAG: carbonic anhydrase, partial [Epsilonproteobacteria bacterium]|nr:carbonic anhydrase [Campylobacterota bacterium]NPA89362.1 carbonic anhydrase [Campylobacterota bacterium]
QKLESGQAPKTLFIGCSDSRVVPNLITSTLPGDLFVIRNIANMVPPYSTEKWECAISVLEYGVKYLEVENIVVCGHSDCGGLKALFYPPEKLEEFPAVTRWLQLGTNLKEKYKGILDEKERKEVVEKANVVEQLERLMGYPYIRERVEKGKLRLLGWYYKIGTGEVLEYREGNWEPVGGE